MKFSLGPMLLAAALAANAQAPEPQAPSAPEMPAAIPSPPIDLLDPVFGLLKERTRAGERFSEYCGLQGARELPGKSFVVVVRKAPCTSRYGISSRDFLEVLFAGKKRYVPVDAVFMTKEEEARLATFNTARIEASADVWRLTSIRSRKDELDKALKALDATSKFGVALLDASIFDVSEYTEGTGFRATVINSGKKTIKYVTFSVVGLNAVGDAVQQYRRGPSVLRGIGPIEPGASATYSKDYMWMTDIVESFRIASIKLEFMDGTSRTVSDTKGIRLSERDAETFRVDDE